VNYDRPGAACTTRPVSLAAGRYRLQPQLRIANRAKTPPQVGRDVTLQKGRYVMTDCLYREQELRTARMYLVDWSHTTTLSEGPSASVRTRYWFTREHGLRGRLSTTFGSTLTRNLPGGQRPD
jgi:hypothetical protein